MEILTLYAFKILSVGHSKYIFKLSFIPTEYIKMSAFQ